MKTLLCLVLSLGVISPAFGQAEMSPDIRMGVARVSMERDGNSPANQGLRIVIDGSKAEIIDVGKVGVREVFDLLDAELGVEWAGNAYHVWAYARYTGGRLKSNFRIDDTIAVIKAQQTETLSLSSSRNGGVVAFFEDGEQKFSENFAVTTLGEHEASLVIAGRTRLELAWTVEPIVQAYACDAGGGTGVTVVEIYIYWFNEPPTSTEGVELMVGGLSIPIASAILDQDLMRINIFVDSVDYQALFNDYAEWDPLPVRIQTTGADTPSRTRGLVSAQVVGRTLPRRQLRSLSTPGPAESTAGPFQLAQL